MISLSDYSSYDGLGLAALVARKEVTPEGTSRDRDRRGREGKSETQRRAANAARNGGRGDRRESCLRVPSPACPSSSRSWCCTRKMSAPIPDAGSPRAWFPTADTELMARFRRAGLVLMGTTQTPELGYNPTTETVLFGPVQIRGTSRAAPVVRAEAPGAAVAAGIVPVAHANDGGGSIRIPAACNGLVGLKPTRDRTPTGPDYADPLCGLAIEFAVTARFAMRLHSSMRSRDPMLARRR